MLTPAMTTARSPRRMEPELPGLRVEGVPRLGIARQAAKPVVIQARDEGRELGAARCVEPRLRGVFRRGLRRVELEHSLAVEVEHGGEETVRQRFSESPDGTEAARLRQMPGGALRGSCVWSRHAHGLARPERAPRSEEHTSELQSPCNLVCRLLLEKKKKKRQ